MAHDSGTKGDGGSLVSNERAEDSSGHARVRDPRPSTLDPLSQRATLDPRPSTRLFIALAIGIVSLAAAYAFLNRPGFSSDFYHYWAATRTLLAGGNPYLQAPVGPLNPHGDVLLYPLPALIVLAPLAPLPMPVAGALFIGISATLLAFLVTRDGYARLPLFLSAPYIMAVSLGQWSPLIMAAAFLPSLGFFTVAKPNLGLPMFAFRPSRRMVVSAGAIVLLSLIVLPTWPRDWLNNIADRPEKQLPLRYWFGPPLLIALFWWRHASARLLVAMACLPQTLLFYDQLPLWLVARSLRESTLLSFGSGILFLLWFERLAPGDYYVQKAMPFAAFLYVFALVILVRRPRTPRPDSPLPEPDR